MSFAATFTVASTTGRPQGRAVLAALVALAISGRFSIVTMDDTRTGLKSMITSAAFRGVGG